MKDQDLVKGLLSISLSIGYFENCILGKMKRHKFEKDKATRASQPLQLIHSDLMGSFQTKSLGGASYVLTFIYDFGMMTFGYLLEHKDQTFDMFKEFMALVKNQTNLNIKMLRLDNRGEYVSNEFIDFCAKHEIKRQFTIPYTSQQSGVAKKEEQDHNGHG